VEQSDLMELNERLTVCETGLQNAVLRRGAVKERNESLETMGRWTSLPSVVL
jgi:hypothetical protein